MSRTRGRAQIRAFARECTPARTGRIRSGQGRWRKKKRPRTGRRESGSAAGAKSRGYFLCRARLSSFRCLCFRIFLRRFLITLPTGCLRAPRVQRRSARKEGRKERIAPPPGAVPTGRWDWSGGRSAGRFRSSPPACQAIAAVRGPSGGRPPQYPSRRSTKRLRTLPSIRLTRCRRGRKGTIGSRRSPRSVIVSRIAWWPGSIIWPRRR